MEKNKLSSDESIENQNAIYNEIAFWLDRYEDLYTWLFTVLFDEYDYDTIIEEERNREINFISAGTREGRIEFIIMTENNIPNRK